MLINPRNYLFGIQSPKPPIGFPEGRIKWSIRSDDFVKAFVRTKDGIRVFAVKEEDEKWVCSFEQARNHAVK